MKFTSDDDIDERRQRKAPPNYFARSTQVRVLIMVFSLMLVIMLMVEARKPENWHWMWAMSNTPVPATDNAEGEIDTRLPVEPDRPSDPPGTVYANDRVTTPSLSTDRLVGEADADDDREDSRERIRQDAWRGMLKQLERDEQLVLFRVLRHSRGGSALSDEDKALWSDLYEGIDQQWKDYLQNANDAVLIAGDELPAEQKTTLLSTLHDLEVEWTDLVSRALRADLEDRPWTELEKNALTNLQSTFDQLALNDIRDDMVWRPEERTAWFRCLEKLQKLSDRELQTQSLGRVGFVQLFRQTKEYRGQLVTIGGTVEMAYEVAAPKNDLGIERYYVFWLRPEDGSDSPIVAYSMELPSGFPPIGNEHTELDEEVTMTGYFFKRWAYGAKDGIRTAPLILAKRPDWEPAPPLVAYEMPSPTMVAIVVLAIALVAIRIAMWVHRAGGTKQKLARESTNEPTPKQFAAMAEAKIGPTITERLQERSERDQADDAS